MALKVGLALGGGASRGLAHLGVIQALTEAKIPIDIVTGASVGGVIGAIYAAHPDIDRAIKNVAAFLESDDYNQTRLDFIKESEQQNKGYFAQIKRWVTTGYFFAISTTRSSFISRATFDSNLSHLIPKIQIEECPIPLGLVATNLLTGQMTEFTAGDLMASVLASAAIPGVFPSITINGLEYVDGSWVEPLPVKLARKIGADFVIAVDVAPKMGTEEEDLADLTGWDVQLRAAEASRLKLKNHCLLEADFSIKVDLMDIHWADFSRLDECVKRGRAAGFKAIEAIEQQLRTKRFKRFFGLG
ncbi:MAG: hypothetical protein A2527_08680 [Candidatus Lambdaproteobacteria bacterium RIFOXYD2_FULL_50_16]|uniref:PNPLA domain-containing protein n=1 Tax=Candidatus Lambdaproteobacteria bacterium RIFOXYD2_FULL_50_16 TaxID=1817772 RepID=A0A1F6GAV2_9PROT|nr:MAG: hypothetical protein A2527_08680 [Candidatus Lambdaproteobacteria bacterium RIFOXYD2_FULL_50_16]